MSGTIVEVNQNLVRTNLVNLKVILWGNKLFVLLYNFCTYLFG